MRLLDLLADLDMSRLQGNYRAKIRSYEKCDLLKIDEWLLVNTKNIE